MIERKEILPISEVYESVKNVLFLPKKQKKDSFVDIRGDIIKGNSQRYQTFFTCGTKCCVCGIEGKYFAKERNRCANEKYHLNLYAVDANGEEVLMTKDHIIPASKGGRDELSNYQTMCIICNTKKGNKI